MADIRWDTGEVEGAAKRMEDAESAFTGTAIKAASGCGYSSGESDTIASSLNKTLASWQSWFSGFPEELREANTAFQEAESTTEADLKAFPDFGVK